VEALLAMVTTFVDSGEAAATCSSPQDEDDDAPPAHDACGTEDSILIDNNYILFLMFCAQRPSG